MDMKNHESVYNGNSQGRSIEEAAWKYGVFPCYAYRFAVDSAIEETIERARKQAVESVYSAVKGSLCIAAEALKGIASDEGLSVNVRACAAQILLRNDLLFEMAKEIEKRFAELRCMTPEAEDAADI